MASTTASSSTGTTDRRTHDLVVVANRLPVDKVTAPDGSVEWKPSPGGLVTAMEPVMKGRGGAWIGWTGEAGGHPPEPFDANGMWLRPIALSEAEVEDHYEGFSNDSLWPIYHDVIVPARFRRRWYDGYRRVNHRFAEVAASVASRGATVWVHDYQLQLVPAMLRTLRPDVRIGWFNHIPFPPVELFAQIPWRRELVEGLLGADLLGFQRGADAQNFLRVVRRLLDLPVKGDHVTLHSPGNGHPRQVRAAAFPISVDATGLEALAKTPEVAERARQIRADLGNPEHLLLGIDRLDYTKGIRHRLKAFQELLADGALSPPETVLVQVATPSRERVDAYRDLRDQVEVTVGRINGEQGKIGMPAVQYLHHSYPKDEMAALYLAGDVLLVTPLRDGMNLVAKEYVACRHNDGGALVLSEFTGAAEDLRQAFLCNPHDISGLKAAILAALRADPRDARRRMRAMRRQVFRHDVQRWARDYLEALAG
ncbi:MAG: trehalose-6-phosphate synthase [Actinomycetota bacterium]|nr:trehalose-6-phosphate synthase [Actinomycetota bacterium]